MDSVEKPQQMDPRPDSAPGAAPGNSPAGQEGLSGLSMPSIFHTTDGLAVQVRPVRAQDAIHLVDLFEHLSAQSRYRRFQRWMGQPDPGAVWREAERLAQIDSERGEAWLAFVDLPNQPNAPVAGVRYLRMPPGLNGHIAEVSIVVRDDLQRKGIGLFLLQFVAEQARMHGVRKFTAQIHSDNLPVWRLLRRSPFPITYTTEGGYITVEVDLTQRKQAEGTGN